MYLQFGSYAHATNEAAVTITRDATWNDGGQFSGYKEQWHITGILRAASQSALTTALYNLKTAYALQGRDIGLYLDDGTATNHVLQSSATIGGLRCVSGPNFPEGEGTEYATYRTYSMVVEGEVFNPLATIWSFHETLSFSGGGPKNIHLQPLTGLPQKQNVAESTPYRVTQTGEAVGRFTYPVPPGPIWPAAWQQEMTQISQRSPKRSGPIGRPSYTEFPISWQYSFESSTPLKGQPNRWLN